MIETAEEDILRCAYGDGKRAHQTLRVEGQGVLVVCNPCHKDLMARDKKKRCQYCGVPIKTDWRKSPLEGFAHQYNCPRNV